MRGPSNQLCVLKGPSVSLLQCLHKRGYVAMLVGAGSEEERASYGWARVSANLGIMGTDEGKEACDAIFLDDCAKMFSANGGVEKWLGCGLRK